MTAEPTPANAALDAFEGAAFDLDGVVTRTARLHAATWKALFDSYLRQREDRLGEPFRAFQDDDYRRYVDGKPRYEGVRSFLKSRGIELPYGTAEDSTDAETVCGLGNRKNKLFRERLVVDGVEVFDSSVALIRALRDKGTKTALVSSSKNAEAVLKAAGLSELFDVRVDGFEAARLGLKGKPKPDTFAYAASQMGVAPAHAFAAEDAAAGVESAKAAGFGLVVGVDRGGNSAALREHGADLVVQDLGELAFTPAREGPPLPDALESFADIAERLDEARPAVFLDYDGTLTPIVARPELALLSETMRGTIRELATLCPVAIISGRDRADVKRLVGLDELIYAGSHGFDISGPNGLEKQHERAQEFVPALDEAEAELRKALARIDGSIVERKRFAISVHCRLVDPAEVSAVAAVVDCVIGHAAGQALRRTGGKKVFGIRPRLPWDKGKAVLWLLETLGLDRPDVLPFYLGDDETDYVVRSPMNHNESAAGSDTFQAIALPDADGGLRGARIRAGWRGWGRCRTGGKTWQPISSPISSRSRTPRR